MRRATLVVVFSAIAFASAARADVPPPSGDCEKKAEGEACTSERKMPGACGRLSYTSTNHATNPPTTHTSTYHGCVEGAAPTAKAKKRGCSFGAAGRGASTDVAAAIAFAGAVVARRRRRSR
jgi:hypothetical protein